MPSAEFKRILIANRGEVAVRIARACEELGLDFLVATTHDERDPARSASTVELPGRGARAYLDIATVIATARAHDCDAIHPGYGFLSENAVFAQACADAAITFIGPSPELLRLFGDKTAARALAVSCDVPVTRGSTSEVSLEQAKAFFDSLPPRR